MNDLITEVLKTEFVLKRMIMERDFYEFVKEAWNVIDPDEFMPAWHIECMCRHLEAIAKRQITILDLNIPPGFAKSLVISVLYPVWRWTTEPHLKFITCSRAMDLAIRDTLKSRRLIESKWFRKYWGHKFKLTTDQNTKGNYENDKMGSRVATSARGGGTGLRGDEILIDDAISRDDANSDVVNTSVNDYLRHTLFNRQSITKQTAIAGIGQRFRDDDYHSVLLSLDGCCHVVLPLEFDPASKFSTKFYTDPRTEEMELLWKSRKLDDKWLANTKLMLGRRDYLAQYQQTPQVDGGDLFKTEWWHYFDSSEIDFKEAKTIIAVDCASKTGEENDFTACIVCKKINNKFYFIDLYHKKVTFPELKRDFVSLAEKHKPSVIYIEHASNGIPLIDEMNTTKFARIIRPVVAKNDKLARARSITPIIERGDVYLLKNAIWLNALITECSKFPSTKYHDDIVDTITLTLNQERANIRTMCAIV